MCHKGLTNVYTHIQCPYICPIANMDDKRWAVLYRLTFAHYTCPLQLVVMVSMLSNGCFQVLVV